VNARPDVFDRRVNGPDWARSASNCPTVSGRLYRKLLHGLTKLVAQEPGLHLGSTPSATILSPERMPEPIMARATTGSSPLLVIF